MDNSSIEWALSNGAPVTCATCPFYFEGNTHCGKTDCGGPGQGKDFPLYGGPIPREKFAERCLVCGADNPKFLIVGLPTKFGLCVKHSKTYQFVGEAAPDRIRLPVAVIAVS